MNYHDAMLLIEEDKTLAAQATKAMNAGEGVAYINSLPVWVPAIAGKVHMPFRVCDEFLCDDSWKVVPRATLTGENV